jgi:hypothetical protein
MHTQNQTSMNSFRRLPQMEAALYLLGDPEEVIRHPRLSRAEKRALLASWASDAYAVENQPTQRRLDNGTVIPVERIISALKVLDEMPEWDTDYQVSGRSVWLGTVHFDKEAKTKSGRGLLIHQVDPDIHSIFVHFVRALS